MLGPDKSFEIIFFNLSFNHVPIMGFEEVLINFYNVFCAFIAFKTVKGYEVNTFVHMIFMICRVAIN